MAAKSDDLEAVRLVADTLQPFTGEERERIIVPSLVQGLRSRGASLRAIADRLNEQGIRTRSGGSWKREYVFRMLRGVDVAATQVNARL